MQPPSEPSLWILHGSITIAGVELSMIPLPFEPRGPVAVSFQGETGRLHATAALLSLVERGEPVFVERFDGK